MSKSNKKSRKNLGKKKNNKRNRTQKRKIYKSCNSCNMIKFGGCPDCGMVSGGGKTSGGGCNCGIKKGGSFNIDKLPANSHYPLNTYKEDVSWPPYVKSSTLLGDFSRTTGGKGNLKMKKMRRTKRGGGVLNFLTLPSSDYVTTHNNINGVWDQKNILAGKSIISSNPMDQPALKNPYGSSINPPLV